MTNTKMAKWLEDVATKLDQSNKAKKKVTASAKKTVVASVNDADMIIMPKSKLPKAVVGNTVKYQNIKWKVVNASYKDKKGTGVVLQRLAAIDTKNLTDPETRARIEDRDYSNLDYNVRETSEVPDFQQAASETEQAIAHDNSYDRTTPEGRYTNHDEDVNVSSEDFEAIAEEPVAMEETDVVTEDATGTDIAPVEEEVNMEDELATVDEEVEEVPAEDEIVEEDIVEDVEPSIEEDEEINMEDEFVNVDKEDEEVTEEKVKVEEPKTANIRKKNRIISAMING